MMPCRSCGAGALDVFLSLGDLPLSDGFLKPEDLGEKERRYPLDVALCASCSLVQILETVPPEELFTDDYPYFSSFSDSWLEHSRKNVEHIVATRNLNESSLVVELASNDGYLLQYFAERDIPVLGIDPAPGPARAAEERGIETLCAFFGQTLAAKLREEGTQAGVVVANNVLAHVADLNGFVAGIATILRDDGVAVIEVPYVKHLMDDCEFDTIYHEHLCYFSVTALDALFRRHGLFLDDVAHLSSHGGSLRLTVSKSNNPSENVKRDLQQEAECGLTRPDYYQDFATRVQGIQQKLGGMVRDLKAEGKTLAAYGAAAKGTILLNYVGLDTNLVSFVVDRNVHKQGKFVPGVRIPIHAPAKILDEMPDYVLLLPWNLKDEILSQQREYIDRGGKFIIPIPEPTVV